MTVSTSLARVQYDTNGTTGPWTVSFKFLADEDLAVIYTDSSGNETTLVLNTDYTVTGAGDPTGGTVTTTAAYAAGGYVTVLRDMDYTQEVDYTDTDSFPAETHEEALDRLTMLVQQVKEVTDRALVFSPSDTAGSELPAAAERANQMLGFNADGQVSLSVPTEGTAAALAIDLADTSAAGKGDALIGVKKTATGAVGTTQHEVNQYREVNAVIDFGADPTGVSDSATAIQNAITSLLTTGGTITFPAGTYRINSTLTITNSTTTKRPGIKFVGQGFQGVTIKSYCSANNSPLIRIRGVPTSATAGTYFIWGGGFENITFTGTNATATGHDCIECLGWWFGEIRNCYIDTFSGNGINSIVDLVYNVNPDWTASNGVQVSNTYVTGCTGYAAKGSYIGSPAWVWRACVFGPFNQGGGMQWYSAGLELLGCSFSACGFVNSTTAAAGTKYSLEIGSASGSGAINGFKVNLCEFDTAKSAHLLLQNVNGVVFQNNRFIHNDRYSFGSLTPATGVSICPNAAGDSAKKVRFIDNDWRFDTAGTATKYNFVNVGNVIDVTIVDGASSNGGGATITGYSGYSASNMHVRQNYQITENGVVVSAGQPAPYVIASTATGSVGAAAATIVFGTVETVCSQVYGSTYYNSGTGVFTAPYTGYYDVQMDLSLTSLAAADFLQIYLRVNGSTVVEKDFNGSGLTRSTCQVKERVYVTAGQTIDIQAANTNSRNIADGRLFIQLVK